MTVLSYGSPAISRALGFSARSKRPLLATIDPLGDVAEGGVGGLGERTPRAAAAGALALLPDDLAPEQQAQAVLEDGGDVGREAAVRLAAEVGDVDRDAAAGFERAGALGEHVLEQLEVLAVRAGDAVGRQLLLVLLAGEVGRRRDDEGHRPGGHGGHVAGVAQLDRIADRRIDLGGREDRVVLGDLGRLEAGVEGRRVVVLPPAHAEVRRRGRLPLGHGTTLRRGYDSLGPQPAFPGTVRDAARGGPKSRKRRQVLARPRIQVAWRAA